MVGTVILRIFQAAGLLAIWAGLQQIMPLANEIASIRDGEPWTLGSLCARIAAVTGPLVTAVVVIWLLELAIRYMAEERQRGQAHPTEPWLANRQWAAKHIRLSNKPLVIGACCFLALYLFVALPLAIASEKTPLMVFAGIFGLVALLILRMMWLNRTWNRAELRISTLPGVIGGPFAGAVILHETFPADTVFDVNLKCELSYTTRVGKESRTERTDLWSFTILIARPLQGSAPGTTALPVNFAIPFDARPTSSRDNETVRWSLRVQKKEEVSTGGAVFEVPVFRTADSRSDYEVDNTLLQEHLAVIDHSAILRRFGLREQQLSADHLRLHFREFDPSIFWTLVVMSVGAVCALAAMWHWIRDFNTLLIAMAFPAVFLLMFLYGIVYMLFWRCTIDLFTTIDKDQPETLAELQVPTKQTRTIVAESGIWGLRKSIRIAADRRTAFRCKLEHRANEKESWSLLLTDPEHSLKILGTLNNASEAQAAGEYLAEKLGISVGKIKAEDGFLK